MLCNKHSYLKAVLVIIRYTTELFIEVENTARKIGLQTNQEKTKYVIVERKNRLKGNKIGHLKI